MTSRRRARRSTPPPVRAGSRAGDPPRRSPCCARPRRGPRRHRRRDRGRAARGAPRDPRLRLAPRPDRHAHPRPRACAGCTRWQTPPRRERIAALAVGGYGRAEMAPFSDVDLLFLTPYKQTPWGESLIESVLYCLWDLRLKVGHAVRTVDDCLRLARERRHHPHQPAREPLPLGRPRAGRPARQTALERPLRRHRPGVRRAQARRARRAPRPPGQLALSARAERQGGQGRPARPADAVLDRQVPATTPQPAEDLVEMGVFTPEEYGIFAEAAAFLWTTRVHLHLLNGRATRAAHLRHPGRDRRRPRLPARPRASVRSSASCRTISPTPSTWATSRASSSPRSRRATSSPRPSLGEKLRTVFAFGKDPTGPGYRLKHGRLDIADESAFREDPVNILRLFEEGLPATPRSIPTRCAASPRTSS